MTYKSPTRYRVIIALPFVQRLCITTMNDSKDDEDEATQVVVGDEVVVAATAEMFAFDTCSLQQHNKHSWSNSNVENSSIIIRCSVT